MHIILHMRTKTSAAELSKLSEKEDRKLQLTLKNKKKTMRTLDIDNCLHFYLLAAKKSGKL